MNISPIKVKKIDKKRFDALISQSRSPMAHYISKELSWYSNEEETVIGVILLDTIDNDFAPIVLGRDEGGRYRAFDLDVSIPTYEEAVEKLIRIIKWHTGKGKKVFPQGDQKKGLDLFTAVVPIEKQHPYFVHLSSNSAFLSAKEIISLMMPHYVDIDGNFIEQFQTNGFDSRLWELYLNAYLTEEQFFFERKYHAPDFMVNKYGVEIAIEAVTVGRKQENPPAYFNKDLPKPKHPDEMLNELENAMPIRFGSSLYSKLKKKYWELDHVKEKPLVFAIADFHDDQSMTWSSTGLLYYLFGLKYDYEFDKNEQLVVIPQALETHKVGEKEIPSGFFFQPKAENISAVLFSSTGTISKFNRLGRQAGFGDPNIIAIRSGTYHDHDPNAIVPKMFKYKVTTDSKETWGEGVSIYHNPNAIHPLPEDLFPNVAHHHLIDGKIVSYLPDFHPYSSVTANIRIQK